MTYSLLHDYPQNIKLYLHGTPHLHDISFDKLPGRVTETVGVHHMKIYGWDNDVIISGANLTHDYFVNRQDRYVLFHDDKLTQFYYEYILYIFIIYIIFKIDWLK